MTFSERHINGQQYMKRYSESLIIREMQVKTIREYYLLKWLLPKNKQTNKQNNRSVGKDVDKKQPYSLLLEM